MYILRIYFFTIAAALWNWPVPEGLPFERPEPSGFTTSRLLLFHLLPSIRRSINFTIQYQLAYCYK